MSFYNGSRADTKPSRTTSDFGESPPSFSDARSKLSYDRPIFSDRFRNFSPSARKSGEEILKDLKEQLRREGDMFFNHSPPDWSFSPKSTLFSKAEDGEDFPRRPGMDDIRGRHGMFRMPAWMSEDDDMSDLAARMSHTPHFATMGRRGGPWRERRSSGGSAMSATSDDSCDAPPTDKSSQCSGGSSDIPSHEIPIRIEAPCPPSMMQQHQQQQLPQQTQQEVENEPISPLSSAFSHRKDTQYPVRTTSAVDATQPPEVTRATRCSSAPPEMADQPLPHEPQKPSQQQRFVSKINITPQSPQSPTCSKSTAIPFSPLPAKFNTVPKPFVPANKQQSDSSAAPYVFEQPSVPEPPQQQINQNQQSHPQLPPYMSQYQSQQQQHPPQQQQQYPSQQQQQYQPQQQQQYQPQQQQQYQPQQQQQYPSQQQFHPQEQQFQHQQYQPQQHQQQQSPRQGGQRPSVVRNIPIFVEGRDGPVSNEESNTPPKNTPQWGPSWNQQQQFYQQPQPAPQQQQQYHQQQHKPQFRQQAQHQQQAPQQQSQPIPTPVPAPPPPQHQPQQQQQNQQQPEPQAKPQSAKDPRLTQIEAVQASVDEYKAKVDAFNGKKNDREFLYLDEMLTRALLQLDNVDPDGRDDVRQARRAVIKNINAAIATLETKCSNTETNNKEKTPENGVISMETDAQSTDTKDSQECSLSNEADTTKSAETMETAETTSTSNGKDAPVEAST